MSQLSHPDRLATKGSSVNPVVKESFVVVALLAGDIVAITASLQSAGAIRDWLTSEVASLGLLNFELMIIAIYLAILCSEGLYGSFTPFLLGSKKLAKVILYSAALSTALLAIGGNLGQAGLIFIGSLSLCSLAYLVALRYVVLRLLALTDYWKRPAVIVGAGKTAELLVAAFSSELYWGYKVVGLIEDNERPLTQAYPRIGSFTDAGAVIAASGVKDVILATPGLSRQELLNLINLIQPLVTNLVIVPDLFEVPNGDLHLETLFSERVILLRLRNNLDYLWPRCLKRGFDIAAATLGLAFVLPILVAVVILIKLDSPGPVLHIDNRLGRNGRVFLCYKFRTMKQDNNIILAEYFRVRPEAKAEWERYAKLRCFDPRITAVGAKLRKYSLDELPQLINVIKGEMSLVGPRPYLVREHGRMGHSFGMISQITPGITGLWQVSGRNNIDFSGRLLLDCWYVKNWSLWLDAVILVKTVRVVFSGRDAY